MAIIGKHPTWTTVNVSRLQDSSSALGVKGGESARL
jgi:hypothetical protein